MGKTIAQMPKQDRPREKLLAKGASALTDQELLAVLLGKGTAGTDVMTLAAKLPRVMDEKGLNVFGLPHWMRSGAFNQTAIRTAD